MCSANPLAPKYHGNQLMSPKLIYVASDARVGKRFFELLLSALSRKFDVTVLNIDRENHKITTALGYCSIYAPTRFLSSINQIADAQRNIDYSLDELVRPYSSIFWVPRILYKAQLASLIPQLDLIIWHEFDLVMSGLGNEPHKMLACAYAERNNLPFFIHGESPTDHNLMFIYEGMNNNLNYCSTEKIDIKKNSKNPNKLKEYQSVDMSAKKITLIELALNPLVLFRAISVRLRHYLNSLNTIIFEIFATDVNCLDFESTILFPLHVVEDSQIQYRNFMLRDQGSVIKRIRSIMPKNWKLVIKAHPGRSGRVPVNLILDVIFNKVILLKRDMPAGTILDKVDCSIVICSTVAFEALQKNKPVGYIGQWEMAEKAGLAKVDINNPDSVRDFISKTISDPCDISKTQLEKIANMQFSGNLFNGDINENLYDEFSSSLLKKYYLYKESL